MFVVEHGRREFKVMIHCFGTGDSEAMIHCFDAKILHSLMQEYECFTTEKEKLFRINNYSMF